MATVVNFIDTTLQSAATRTVNLPTAQISLPPSAFFHVTTAGVGSPTSITLTPTLKDLAGTISFTCTGGTLTNVTATSADLTYANMSASTATVTAAVTVNGSTYTTLCTVSKVLDGATGTNTCRVYAYQRAASAPTGSPGDVTVTFASNSITYPAALANGWVFDIPTTNGNPLYVTAISGAGSGATVNLLSAGWSGAAVMATDGPGGTGTNGTNGLNSATITIYQRSATATALSLPSASTTYTFATGVLTGLNNGWSTAYPAADSTKPFVQMSLATAISAAATDAIAASEWNAAQLQYDATAVINAQASADAANAALTNIASDNILSPSEKPAVVQDYTVITNEQSGIDSRATAYGITTEKTNYDNAVSALTSYLGTLTGWNTIPGTDVTIVGTTFRSNFTAVYANRQILLNAISTAAGNASRSITLIGRGVSVVGTTATKTASTTAWDSDCRSTDSHLGGCFASATMRNIGTAQNVVFGLSADPVADGGSPGSYIVLKYSVQLDTVAGNATAVETSATFSLGAYAYDDVWLIRYNGVKVEYLKNGTVMRTVAASPGLLLYFDSSFYTPGSQLSNIQFGPMSSNDWAAMGGTGKPADNATVGAPSGTNVAGVLSDTLVSQAAAGNTASNTLNSPPVISTISNVTATNVYKPAVTIATKTPGVTAGVGPFIFDWREENITVGDVDITYTLSSASNTNDTCTIKAISQVTGGLPSQDRVTVTVTDVKGRVSITQFTVNASC